MTKKRPGLQRRRKPRPRLDPDIVGILSEVRGFLMRNRAEGYVVGGFLRDWVIGTPSKDLDLVVSGVEPDRLARHLHRHLGFSRPVVFPRFETALTVGRGVELEICRLQGDLGDDAAARDFTLNCLYAEVGRLAGRGPVGKFLDPTGKGFEDLRRGVLRTPVDACTTLWLDPLRILRAVRLGAVRGFRPAGSLRECIPRLVYLLDGVAKERVRAELEMILLSRRVTSSFRMMQALGISEVVLPELSSIYGYDQSTPYHAYDLFTHTLKTTANAPADLTLRLAALLHDIGKPATRRMKAGRAVYYGHQKISARLAENVIRRLKFPKRIREGVLFLVRNHMIHYSPAWSDKAVRRFVRKSGSRLDSMLILAAADQRAQMPGAGPALPARDLGRRIRTLRRSAAIHLEPPMDGHEIMAALGLEEGPLVGRAKMRLLEEASSRDRPMTRQEALEALRKWAKNQQHR